MATTGILNGTLIGIYVNGVKVSNLMSNGRDLTMATRDTTNKDTSGWKTALGGMLSSGAECEGLMAEDATFGYEDLYDLFILRAAVTVMESSAVSGDIKYSQSMLMTSLKRTNPLEANSTFTVSFEGTGAITKATI